MDGHAMNPLLNPDIIGSYMQGAQARQSLKSNEQAIKANEMKFADAQAQQAKQQQYNQLMQSGLPPEQMSQQAMKMGNVDLATQLMEYTSKQSKEQQDRIMTGAQNVYAFTKGAKDANDPVFMQGIQKALQSQMIDPQGAKIAAQLGPKGLEQFVMGGAQGMTPYQQESLDLQRQRLDAQQAAPSGVREFQYYQNLKKTNPQEAANFGRERGFISKEGQELSAHLQKRLSSATDDAVTSEKHATQFKVLADEIDKADIGGGLIGGKWGEKLKDISGNQDEVTNLRRRYLGVRASQVIQNLPPGPASDADIVLALSGFPTENASGKQISSFLRGLSKIETLNAEFNTFKADYIAGNGHERNLLGEWKKSKEQAAQQPASRFKVTVK